MSGIGRLTDPVRRSVNSREVIVAGFGSPPTATVANSDGDPVIYDSNGSLCIQDDFVVHRMIEQQAASCTSSQHRGFSPPFVL